jgi:Pyruvate/2-oxoacid:ferredoxin oxidoreductase delta subunit
MKIANPFLKPSTRAFLEEARQVPGYTLLDFIHGYVYARWPYTYIGIGVGTHPLSRWLALFGKWFDKLATKRRREEPPGVKIGFADTYHGKTIPLVTARKMVLIDEELRLPDLEQVIPYQRARSIILKNPDHIVAMDCPCRSGREHPCLPMDVCLVVGDPFASFIREHQPHRSRRVTRDEAIAILQAEDARGHVHHAFFKDAMLDRFYAICNCCECCCGAMHAHRSGTPMLASSGYICRVDRSLCSGCSACSGYCQFGALELVDGINEVDRAKCMGCGVCIDKCPQGALSLLQDESKGVPLEISSLMTRAAASK